MTEDYVGPVLLDTCAIIYLAQGNLSSQAANLLVNAALAGGVYVSPVSAWEIGLLSRPGRPGLQFLPNATIWFQNILARPAIRLIELSPEVAIAASSLPEPLHGDPADRLLIATARDLGVPLMTSDGRIVQYADRGHVFVVAC